MSYSTEPTTDAWRYFADLDAHNNEVQANRQMFEEMFLEACKTGDANAMTHGDAVTVRTHGPLGTAISSTLQPLHKTMCELCESSDAGREAMEALLFIAIEGHPLAMNAIKALAREYGEQKAG